MEMYGMTGERLGTIGRAEGDHKEQLSSWQRDMISKPSISIRRGYAANYDPPYEDASVLVLTATSGKFVDIRFPREMTKDKTTADTKARQPLSSYKAFWAFSGTADTTFYTSSKGGQPDSVGLDYTAHVVFHHDIDSKGPGIVDEGDMFLLPNGDTMEVGMDTDTKTGKVKMYKEYWTAPESAYLGENGLGQPLRKAPCIVMETTDGGHGRGLVIRIGDFCQGIYQSSSSQDAGDVVVVRTERGPVPGDSAGSSMWTLDPRSNVGNVPDEYIPFEVLLGEDTGLSIGSTKATQHDVWVVTEIQP